jgi:hypothetical protein
MTEMVKFCTVGQAEVFEGTKSAVEEVKATLRQIMMGPLGGWLPRCPTLVRLPGCLSHSEGGLCQYLIKIIISLRTTIYLSPLHHSQPQPDQIHTIPSTLTNNTIAMTSEAQSKMLTLESSDGETIPVGKIDSISTTNFLLT